MDMEDNFPLSDNVKAISDKVRERKNKTRKRRERKAMPRLLAILKKKILAHARKGYFSAPISEEARQNRELVTYLYQQGFHFERGNECISWSQR